MDFFIAINIIGWFIVAMMGTGLGLIKVFEKELKKDEDGVIEMDDLERASSRAFLQQYWDSNLAGKVNFLLLHGARFWGIIMGRIKDNWK